MIPPKREKPLDFNQFVYESKKLFVNPIFTTPLIVTFKPETGDVESIEDYSSGYKYKAAQIPTVEWFEIEQKAQTEAKLLNQLS